MFGRARKRIDKVIKKSQTKTTETKKNNQSSDSFQKVFTIPHSQAAIRIARNFKSCSDFGWDDEHKNIIITFNNDVDINSIQVFKSYLDQQTDLDDSAKLIKNLISHIKDYGDCWDIYNTVDGNIEAHLRTNQLEIDIVSKFLNGFADNTEDLLYIKIKSISQNKSISINQNVVSYFIMEELYDTLCEALNTSDALFKIIAEDVKNLCGK